MFTLFIGILETLEMRPGLTFVGLVLVVAAAAVVLAVTQ